MNGVGVFMYVKAVICIDSVCVHVCSVWRWPGVWKMWTLRLRKQTKKPPVKLHYGKCRMHCFRSYSQKRLKIRRIFQPLLCDFDCSFHKWLLHEAVSNQASWKCNNVQRSMVTRVYFQSRVCAESRHRHCCSRAWNQNEHILLQICQNLLDWHTEQMKKRC